MKDSPPQLNYEIRILNPPQISAHPGGQNNFFAPRLEQMPIHPHPPPPPKSFWCNARAVIFLLCFVDTKQTLIVKMCC